MPFELAQVLWLFVPAYAADVAPVLARHLLPGFAAPLDFGATIRGRPVLGDHKTWRGLLAGVIAGVVAYRIQKGLHGLGILPGLALVDPAAFEILPGVLLGFGAIAGDAVKSFFKRQAGIPPGRAWIPFDQLDFYAGALVAVSPLVALPTAAVLLSVPVVFASDLGVAWLAWRVGFKDAWP